MVGRCRDDELKSGISRMYRNVARNGLGTLAEQLRVDALPLAIDLLGSGAQSTHNLLGEGQGHFRLSGEHAIGARAADEAPVGQSPDADQDPDLGVDLPRDSNGLD